jgi:glutaminase
MNYQNIIEEIIKEVRPLIGNGRVADYIPELAKIMPNKLGIALCDIDGNVFSAGDAKESFSIQSISKLFTLTMAMNLTDEQLWQRVGMEPSGQSFNSLIQLEQEKGIPRNPFINPGAIVITDIISEIASNPAESILNYIREISLNNNIKFNDIVAKSEASCGYRNASLAYLMKEFNNINKNVYDVLNLYYRHCSLEMTCEDLARSAYFLINKGRDLNGKEVLNQRNVKRVNSLMMTSGLYDNAGNFAYHVGLPAKSGVGGGILAILPGEFSIIVWSPELNEAGNSIAGMKALELFTTKTAKSIF